MAKAFKDFSLSIFETEDTKKDKKKDKEKDDVSLKKKDSSKYIDLSPELKEEEIDEALTGAQRRKRARSMKRKSSRIAIARRKKMKRRASPDDIKRRAQIRARTILKNKLTPGKKKYGDLSYSQRNSVDKKMSKIPDSRIKAIARKQMVQAKKDDRARLSKKNESVDLNTLFENTFLVNEIFDNPYPWSWKETKPYKKVAVFRTLTDDVVEIQFNLDEGALSQKNIQWGTEVMWHPNNSIIWNASLNGFGNQFRIFGTILDILKDFVNTYKPLHLYYESTLFKDSSKKPATEYKKILARFAKEVKMNLRVDKHPKFVKFSLLKKTLDESFEDSILAESKKSAPSTIRAALNAATKMPTLSKDRTKFKINNKVAQSWLTQHFGLVTDDNEHEIDGFTVNFDWKTQEWYISNKSIRFDESVTEDLLEHEEKLQKTLSEKTIQMANEFDIVMIENLLKQRDELIEMCNERIAPASERFMTALLDYMHSLVKLSKGKTSLESIAFDVAREFNTELTVRDIKKKYEETYG